MPYIDQKSRRKMKKGEDRRPTNTGELNYCVTLCVKRYIESHPRVSYDVFNWVIGVLDEIKFELGDREWGYGGTDGLKKEIGGIVRNYLKGWPHISTHELTQVRGALTCVQLELYRRVVGPYEDIKIQSHGDVLQ